MSGKIRRETVLAPSSVKEELLGRYKKAKDRAVDPWEEAAKPFHPMQFKDFVLPKDADALVLSEAR